MDRRWGYIWGHDPKVNAAIACLDAGIPSVQIVDQFVTGTVIAYEGVLN